MNLRHCKLEEENFQTCFILWSWYVNSSEWIVTQVIEVKQGTSPKLHSNAKAMAWCCTVSYCNPPSQVSEDHFSKEGDQAHSKIEKFEMKSRVGWHLSESCLTRPQVVCLDLMLWDRIRISPEVQLSSFFLSPGPVRLMELHHCPLITAPINSKLMVQIAFPSFTANVIKFMSAVWAVM